MECKLFYCSLHYSSIENVHHIILLQLLWILVECCWAVVGLAAAAVGDGPNGVSFTLCCCCSRGGGGSGMFVASIYAKSNWKSEFCRPTYAIRKCNNDLINFHPISILLAFIAWLYTDAHTNTYRLPIYKTLLVLLWKALISRHYCVCGRVLRNPSVCAISFYKEKKRFLHYLALMPCTIVVVVVVVVVSVQFNLNCFIATFKTKLPHSAPTKHGQKWQQQQQQAIDFSATNYKYLLSSQSSSLQVITMTMHHFKSVIRMHLVNRPS